MPDDLVLNVRQITQYPTVAGSNGGDALLMQTGGLGGPYVAIAAANLVATALNGTDDTMAMGGTLEVGTDLVVGGSAAVAGTLNVTGTTELGGLLVPGTITAAGGIESQADLVVARDTAIGGTLTVTGTAELGGLLVPGTITAAGGIESQGPLIAAAGFSMSGPLYVSGPGSFAGDLMSGGGLQTGAGALIGGSTRIVGSLTVEGGVGLLDCLSVGKDATIGGHAQLSGGLDVEGDSCLRGHLGITGNLDVGNGNLTLGGNFTAEGITTLRATEMCVTGNAGICGNLNVAGLVNAGSGYFKDGLATAGNAVIDGPLTVTGHALLCGPVRIDNDLTVNGRVGVCGFLHLNGMAVATEPWVTGYVCHVGADLLDAITDVAEDLESKITASIAGVASFNERAGAVVLQSADITGASGVLQPPDDDNWYAWHGGAWATFEPDGGGGGGGDTGIADVPSGITAPQARVYGAWQPTVTAPPGVDNNYYAWRNGGWAMFDPSGGGTGGITQQDLDNALANYLPLAGGTLSGALTLPNANASGNQAVRYTQLATYLPLAGGILTGPLTLPADGTGSQAVRYSQMASAISGFVTTSAMTTAIGTATTGMATQTWTNGQITTATNGMATQGFVTSAIGTATAGMATQTWVGQQIAAIPPAPNTLQVSWFVAGKPAANQYYSIPVTVPMRFTDSTVTTAHRIFIGTPPAAAQIIRVYKQGGSAFITMNVDTSGNVSWTGAGSDTTFAVGEVIQLRAPNTQDTALADIGVSLLATRT